MALRKSKSEEHAERLREAIRRNYATLKDMLVLGHITRKVLLRKVESGEVPAYMYNGRWRFAISTLASISHVKWPLSLSPSLKSKATESLNEDGDDYHDYYD